MIDAFHQSAATYLERLRQGDPVAPADFAEAVLPLLLDALQRYCPQSDDHFRIDAAHRTILDLIKKPESYQPERGLNLLAYLVMAARGDLLNLEARERRQFRKRQTQDCVELPAAEGNSLEDEADLSFDHPGVAAAIRDLSEQDRQVWELMRDGQRRTEPYAAILGIADCSIDEQRRAVKRAKDRIIKRLKRAREAT